jgi:hypothetical protein
MKRIDKKTRKELVAIKKRLPADCKSVVEKCLEAEELLIKMRTEIKEMRDMANLILSFVFPETLDPILAAKKVLDDEWPTSPVPKPMLRTIIKMATNEVFFTADEAYSKIYATRNEAVVLHTKLVYYSSKE